MSESNSYRWLVVAMTVVNQAVALGIGLYCFAIFSIPWLEQFDVSRGQLMMAIAFFQVANGLAAPFIGQRLDKIPLLWPVIVGYLLFCAGLGVLSIATAYWQVIAVYATFFAVGQMLFGTLISQVLINRWFTKDNGLALGISATGTSLGGILFPLLISQALSSYDLPAIFQTIALVCIVVLIPLNLLIFRVQPPVAAQPQPGARASAAPAAVWTTREILGARAFWIPILVLLSVGTAFVAIQSNLGVHLNDLNYPAAFTGQMIAVISAMMIVGKLLYGRLADKFDHAYLLLFMGCMSIAGVVLLMLTTSKPALLTAAVLLGVASGGLIPLQGAIFVKRFGVASFGKVMGLVMMVMILGGLGPIYTAWIYDVFSSYQYAFISFILMTVPTLLLLKWLPKSAEPAAREAVSS